MELVRLVVGPVVWILDLVLRAYTWVIVARALISWVDPNPYNPVVRTLRALTDPVLRPFQRLQWRLTGGRLPVDLSPVAVIVVILFVRRFLFEILVVLHRL